MDIYEIEILPQQYFLSPFSLLLIVRPRQCG